MVAQQKGLDNGTPKGGKRSRNAEKFLPAEQLEFITQDVHDYKASGGSIKIIPEFRDAGRRAVVVILYDTQIVDGAIVPLVANDSEPAKVDNAPSGTA